MSDVTLHLGDCLEVMATIPENSVDTCITDPPYELGFMGKKWDSSGIAFQPETWQAVYRVLKPGAILLAFGGTRTYHRMVCAIEDAGFEIRDTIAWVYGSGFPKSYDISKGIDKHGGNSVGWFGQWFRDWRIKNGITQKEVAGLFPSKTGGLTGCVANWELGFNMPTAEQFSTIVKRYGLPFSTIEEAEREVIGKQKNAMQGWSMDGNTKFVDRDITLPATPAAQLWHGWGTALKPAFEPIVVAMKPIDGTFVNNALTWGVAGYWIDGGRVGYEGGGTHCNNRDENRKCLGHPDRTGTAFGLTYHADEGNGNQGRFPANFVHDGSDEVVGLFPQSNGNATPRSNHGSGNNCYGDYGKVVTQNPAWGDSGSAARFFMTCKQDDLCSLCLTPKHSIMSNIDNSEVIQCKSLFANNVEKSLTTTQATTLNIAQESVQDWLIEKAVHFAKSVGNLCEECATSIVREVVEIKTWDSKNVVSPVIQDFIGNSNKCILIQNLAQYAEIWDSIDTTPTTTSLLTLFGYASRVITNYIQETEKTAPKRFLYSPKASRKERNAGLEGMEAQEVRPLGISNWEGQTNGSGKTMGKSSPSQNHHPTVKPIELMRYLVRLTKTPTGGVVLDPFMGSGTTGIACVLEGREFIGIEREAEYVEIAEKRIAEAQLQSRLPLEVNNERA